MSKIVDELLGNPAVLEAALEEVRATTAEALANAQAAKADALESKAKARVETARAKVSEIALDREVEKRELEKLSDFHQRVYRFSSDVNQASVSKCMSVLAAWGRLSPGCDITLVFNSPGGGVIEGMALFDFIQELRRKGHHVTTKSLGYAASMAGILLQAGERRVMAKESWILIHQGSAGVIGSMGEIEDKVEWFRRIDERILDIFYDRSRSGDKPLSRSVIKKKYERKDWWLDSDEALAHGFCDEVE